MITASKEFKEKLKKGANIVNYADITLSDGMVLHLTYKDFMIGGCSIEDKTTDGKFGVGFVIGKTLTIKIANHDERFSKYDFYNSIIRVYVAMAMNNGTIEKIRKGVYYATVPSTTGEIIEINAVDGMFLLDKDYSVSRTTYPATLQTILTNACLDCGIPIGFRQFDNMSFTVKEKPESGTYRQIVSYACQIAGYNARIDNDGYMQLIWYNSALLEQYNYVGGDFKQYPHDTIVDGGNFKDYSKGTILSGGTFTDAMPEHIFQIKTLDVHTDDVQITGVRVIGEDDKTVLFGEEGYLIEVKNPFAGGKEQEVSNYLGQRMVGMVFRPFTAQVLSNPLYEPFEVVRVSDRKGNTYVSIINSVSYIVGSYTQISCQAEDPVRNGSMYYSEAAAAVVEARRNTQKQLSTYDKAVQQMNQLAGNAMGFHTTYEEQADGSRITYLHDKPTLSGSKTIYKQTIDGFFISTDGGKTYTAGFDKNGNAVVNILYAIGIVADWIRGGTLTLGGYDNVHGDFKALDSEGNQIVSIDKDGIYINDSSLKFTITGNKIENIIELTAIIENTKYVTHINPTGVSSFVYRMDENNEWKLKSSSSKSGSTITVSNPNGYQTQITENGVILNSLVYFFRDRLKIGSSYFSQLGVYINNESTYLRSGTLKVGASTYADDWMSCKGYGYFESYVNSKSGTSIFNALNVTRDSYIGGNLSISGRLTATGTKSRVAKTSNYSERLLYCYETSKPYFGDIGEATLDESGLCYIFVDDIFLETINTDCQYQVFLQKYGQGDVWVEERKPNYFLIKGTPNLKFGWELKARQSGYEMERLERFVQEEPEEAIDYEKEAKNYIDEYYREVLNYEKSN